jgi:predicted nucleotidyltransferase
VSPEAEKYREQLRAMLPELRERYGVSELGLFGSRVRGDHQPDSDLDVLVTFAPGTRIGLFGFVGLENHLSDRLGLKVDLVPRDSLKPYIGRRILAEVQYL